GDKLLLERCVLNLLTNAVKYSENGGLITISVKNQEGNGLVEIRDQGIGIPEKERAHIFEPFYRVDKSRSRAVGGAGLGLAIVKEIVDLHGGELQCFSNEPQGTVFQVLLPMRKD
ncbi:MAG: ATP-binding protein, partial [Oscillospiraceae bacterium]